MASLRGSFHIFFYLLIVRIADQRVRSVFNFSSPPTTLLVPPTPSLKDAIAFLKKILCIC